MELHAWRYEPIKIPKGIIDFFAPRGHYVQRVEYNRLIHNMDLMEARIAAQGKHPLVAEHSFTNNDERSERSANYHATLAAKFFYGQGTYANIRKEIMLNTGTEPIKIRFDRDNIKRKKAVYVKRPDVNRIIGKYIYNIISGYSQHGFGFNETSFIEEEVSGTTLSDPRISEWKYLKTKKYKAGLVRAAVHVAFLDLIADIREPDNRLIDTDMNTILFDFNLVSRGDCDEADIEANVLLQPYMEKSSFLTDELVDVFKKERDAVARRVLENRRNFFRVMNLAGDLVAPAFIERKSVDDIVREYSGDSSLAARFERKVKEYLAA